MNTIVLELQKIATRFVMKDGKVHFKKELINDVSNILRIAAMMPLSPKSIPVNKLKTKAGKFTMKIDGNGNVGFESLF